MSRYSYLEVASIGRDYLHTNATTHEFLFGAMAELVDNSRDALARTLRIYTSEHPDLEGKDEVNAGFSMNFLDDGQGMSPVEVMESMTFGKSYKRDQDLNLIGQYGNGLKSASMRLAEDVIFFTKKDNIQTILLLSRTFLKEELGSDDAIRLMIPSFHVGSMKPYLIKGKEGKGKDMEIHIAELDLVKRWSPFKTDAKILEQFNKIEGTHGTLVVCFNMRLLENGQSEFDFETDQYDIKMAQSRVDYSDRKSQEEHNSFRSYCSILYYDPKMKIYIQNKKVRTKMLERTLYYPRCYEYASTKFKAHDEKEKKIAEDNVKALQNKLGDKKSSYNGFLQKYDRKSKEDARQLTEKKHEWEIVDSQLQQAQLKLSKIKKSFGQPKMLKFVFGVNVNNRSADGLFLYNCHRLILMYEHTKQQSKGDSYRGIVGLVDVPRMVLAPNHNKQCFAAPGDEKTLKNELGNFMEYYIRDLKAYLEGKVLNLEFWRPYGYTDMDMRYPPSDEDKCKRMRIQAIPAFMVQCDSEFCLKWRCLSFNRKMIDPAFPADDWECKDNTEVNKDNCRVPEAIGAIPIGEIIRTFEEVRAPADRSNSRKGFSLSSSDKNGHVQTVVPQPRDPESATAYIKRKRSLNTLDSDDSSDLSQNNNQHSARSELRSDPTYRLNGNNFNNHSSKNSKKTKRPSRLLDSDLEEEEEDEAMDARAGSINSTLNGNTNNRTNRTNDSRSIFEDHAIDNERVEDDIGRLPVIKPEPGLITRLLEDSMPLRYSFESGIQVTNEPNGHASMNFSPNVRNAAKDSLLANLNSNHKTVLVMLAEEMGNQELINTTKELTTSDLAYYNINEFMKDYKHKMVTNSNAQLKSTLVRFTEFIGEPTFIESTRNLTDDDLNNFDMSEFMNKYKEIQYEKVRLKEKGKVIRYKEKCRDALSKTSMSKLQIDAVIKQMFNN